MDKIPYILNVCNAKQGETLVKLRCNLKTEHYTF